MQLPNDKFLLLSFVNTKLRDNFTSLSAFCEEFNVTPEEVEEKLKSIGYTYDKALNKFI